MIEKEVIFPASYTFVTFYRVVVLSSELVGLVVAVILSGLFKNS